MISEKIELFDMTFIRVAKTDMLIEDLICHKDDISFTRNLGSVVQNFVRLTSSLSPQFVNYISTSNAKTVIFVEKM